MIRPILAAALLVVLPAVALPAQQEQGEFSAQGVNVVRIENEAKLRVPLEITDEVWAWLQKRYADCAWLNQDDSVFTATFGDEGFQDVYCDTPDLKLLAEQSGIRHRSRVIHSGSAMRKDGRQLLQIKLNRADPTGLARSEIKFTVEPSGSQKTVDDVHPVIGLVGKDQREDCKARIRELGIDPYELRPILTVDQNRRRVYLSDQKGAFATLTLDLCSSTSWGTDLKWTEIELELNEIRYTEADATGRKWMERINEQIQADLMAAFPGIVQDQTPKYNKSFAMIESATWMPVRTLVRWNLQPRDVWAVLGLGAVVLVGGIALLVMRMRRARARAQAA